MPIKATVLERFIANLSKTKSCWNWTGFTNAGGYGIIRAGRRTIPTHRLAWELAHGLIPSGLCVLHRCDNPKCVRPYHLFLGTQTDNIKDREQKKRTANGIKIRHAILNDAIVRKARIAHYRRGESRASLARKYKVGFMTMHRAVRRLTWKHVQ